MTRDVPSILLVDDEASIRDPLAEYLTTNGFAVTAVSDAAAARASLDDTRPDLIVLDIMMPGEDGLSLTRHVRSGGDLPIILLTAKGEDLDRILGLEMGADDYLTKPFNPRELLARIKSVLRRTDTAAPDIDDAVVYEFAELKMDIRARTLSSSDGKFIELTGGEFSLLQVLVERAGRVLNRDQLLDYTQGREASVFDRSIDNQISRLRKKIEMDPKAPQVIKTVRGGGYILSSAVTRS